MALTDGLLGSWNLNNSWEDSSGNGKHLENIQGALFDTDAKLGSHAASTDGIDDVVRTIEDFDSPSSITIAGWVRRDSTGRHDFFLSKDNFNAGKRNWQFIYNGTNNKLRWLLWTSGSYDVISGTTAITDSNWHFVMADYNSSTGLMRVFLDDPTTPESSKTHSVGGAIHNSADKLSFMDTIDDRYPEFVLKGDLDGAAIWNRPLTQAERLELWNDGNGIEIGAEEGIAGGIPRSRIINLGGV